MSPQPDYEDDRYGSRAVRSPCEEGRPIGYAIALPDINVLLKGLNERLFPLGFIRLLQDLPGLRHYRLFGLTVSPEYQKKTVDSWPMIKAIVKLGAKE